MAADPAQFRLLPVKGVNLDVPITVLANRPDLRAAEYRLQASQQSVNAQKRSWYPSITLGASLSTSSDKAKSTFNIPMLGGSATINLPFLNWQTMKWKDKTVQAEMDSAKLNFEKALTPRSTRSTPTTLPTKTRRPALPIKNSVISWTRKTAITIKCATNTVKTS